MGLAKEAVETRPREDRILTFGKARRLALMATVFFGFDMIYASRKSAGSLKLACPYMP